MFGVFVGVAFGSSGDSGHNLFGDSQLLNSLLIGPVEIIGGILAGVVLGMGLRLLTNTKTFIKSIVSFVAAYSIVFVSGLFGMSGLGFLGTIAMASTASMKWEEEAEHVEDQISVLWKFLQIPLFGLIGASIYFSELEGDVILKSIGVVLIGLCFRIPAAFSAVSKTGLINKEKLFVAIAWMPKATVQAALGGVVLGRAEESDLSSEYLDTGTIFLTAAVFSILISAPLGSILTAYLGPKLLEKGTKPKQVDPSSFGHRTLPEDRYLTEVLKKISPQYRRDLFSCMSMLPVHELDMAIKEVEQRRKGEVSELPKTIPGEEKFRKVQSMPLENQQFLTTEEENRNRRGPQVAPVVEASDEEERASVDYKR